jgi:phenylpropionate dioxygenase-like ring-hydroxylating dioxygenase large terminal subunit
MNSNISGRVRRADRCDAISYQELLDSDSRPVPDVLRAQAEPDLGADAISTEPYLSADFFRRSIDKMWMKVWQMACREEAIPNIGDYVIYEIANKSLIIVRTDATEIRALYNACLHRGRKLVTGNGCRQQFKCPFHGFVWKNDGTFLENPIEWDFPGGSKETMALPQARVGRWGGFVFVNFSDDALPFETILDPLVKHFERWDVANRHMSAHVVKVVKCNWLIAIEAFLEAHHSTVTHPQIIKASGDMNAQVDVFTDHVSRIIAAKGISSPSLKNRAITEDDIVRCALGPAGRAVRADVAIPESGPVVPEGVTARSYLGNFSRDMLTRDTGIDYSQAADAEFGDTIQYSVFPNFLINGGFLPNLVITAKPNGMDHLTCVMEVMILSPVGLNQVRPKCARLRTLGESETWADAEELGMVGRIINQDMGNMPFVQEGVATLKQPVVRLGKYTESRIRAHHLTLREYMNA